MESDDFKFVNNLLEEHNKRMLGVGSHKLQLYEIVANSVGTEWKDGDPDPVGNEDSRSCPGSGLEFTASSRGWNAIPLRSRNPEKRVKTINFYQF